MILPIGDSPNPRGVAWINWTLIVLNVAVFLALWPLSFRPADPRDPDLPRYVQALVEDGRVHPADVPRLVRRVSAYDLFTYRHGFRPAHPTLAGALAGMFLHGGWAHLLGNMLFLWIYGDNVEARLGRLGYLLAYLGTGLAAAGGDFLLRHGSDIPAVGASGAISGVLGLYFLWFPLNRVRLWVWFFPFFADVIELPARLVLAMYLVVDNLLPVLVTGGKGGGVAYGAHIGGFIAGLALAWVMDRHWLHRPEVTRERPPDVPAAATLPRAFREALAAGRLSEAAAMLFDLPRQVTRNALGPREKIRLGDALANAGHPRAALAAYQRALADHPRGPGRARAHLGAARVLMDDLGFPTAAYQHLYHALEEDPDPAEEAEARELLEKLARRARSVPRSLPRPD